MLRSTPPAAAARAAEQADALERWVKRKGGSVSVRDLMRGPSRYRTKDAAEAALTHLSDGVPLYRSDLSDEHRELLLPGFFGNPASSLFPVFAGALFQRERTGETGCFRSGQKRSEGAGILCSFDNVG